MTKIPPLAPADIAVLLNETQTQVRVTPDPARHRLTPAEAVDRAQLLALFDKSDTRGQKLLLIIAGIHAARYPKE